MSLYAESEPNISTQRKDMIILETLSQPGEITSAIVGHFLNRKQQTLILAKQTILSIFNYDSETQQFHLLDHKPTFKQVFSIHQVPQQNMLDYIVVITINGEGMLLQWHENDFFPLAVGQYLDAALNVMENPLRRRIYVNPQYVQIIPIDQHTNSQLSKPIQTHRSKLLNENDTKQLEAQSNIIDEDSLNYERVLARSVCFIDECVCSGIIYDGPGSDLMYDISNNYDKILENIPQMFDWGDEYEATIENGLEHIWKDKQKQKQRKNKEKQIQEPGKEKIVIAQSQIFIFAEEGSSDIIGGKSLIMDSIIRYRYIAYMNSMILSDFPFNQSDNRDHSFDDKVSLYAIVDTAEGVCLLSINMDFSKQTMKLGPFVMIEIPNSSSRIIAL
ncbi:MAG: hypothetical protein EZS28_025815 [Streblomastix strix]|uniref:RSE1/DDB1/CPSF1 first beta-propeller domain-containing protein n=1 Tax=Streblomastix strix TaxID=222440 RepID=A0A5J4V7K6_9EUKA|nr:MAG: hypothetical protein EZS28_025815 [Streblomastix strix]